MTYTPPTNYLREIYIGYPNHLGAEPDVVSRRWEEFDRWMAGVKAEALRDAALPFSDRLADGTGNGRAYNSHQVAQMLRAEANRIEAAE